MHFRIVCLIKLMSAARLDQVSAHDTFNFCTSHVHAFFFHAYVLSFLPFLSMCCVSFCSLSLSLSLSQIDCVIAPKQHKSTPAQNPLQGFGSSSSFPPSHIRFRDKKAKKDFFQNFQKRGIHPECQVILSDFADTPLLKVIRT